MKTFGFVVMGLLTLASLYTLWLAWRQPASRALQRTWRGTGGQLGSGGLKWFVNLLLAAVVIIEAWGLYLSFTGYLSKPLNPTHALYIFGTVVASALVAIFLYMASAQSALDRSSSA
jgi:hypothetical protein